MSLKDLKTRSITASILIAVYILLLYFLTLSGFVYQAACLVFVVIAFIAVFELSNLALRACQNKLNQTSFIIIFSLPIIFILFNQGNVSYLVNFILLSVFVLNIAASPLWIGRNSLSTCISSYRFIFPAALICLGLASFLYLVIQGDKVSAIVWLTILVVVSDTAAYLFGKQFGKTSLSSAISPSKTIEGTLAGLVSATIVGYLLFDLLCLNLVWYDKVLISLIISFAATFGDLLESYIKRIADVKDSSNILPGHGGVLDRIDALIFASIFVNFLYWS